MHKPPPPRLMGELAWLHEDDWLVAVNKPAGLLSVPGRGPENADCAALQVQQRYPDARVVHRLDMGTSGILIFARHLAAQQALSRAFETRQTDKRYEALVTGLVQADEGEVDLPLRCDWPNRPRQMVDAEQGKRALTRWQVLSRDAAQHSTRIALFPVTGRSHQLRVHMQALGHAIVGDELYAEPRVAAASPRLMLHAAQLALPHPGTGLRFVVECPTPF